MRTFSLLIVIDSLISLILFTGCIPTNNPVTSSHESASSFDIHSVTLKPPLKNYGIQMNLDPYFIRLPDFSGIRVEWNNPHFARPRSVGQHPKCITYYFWSGGTVRQSFDPFGHVVSTKVCGNQPAYDVDFSYGYPAPKNPAR